MGDNFARARRNWNRAQPIEGSMAQTYLRARGNTAPLRDTLRFVADIYHMPWVTWRCALVANVQPTGDIHLIYLTKNGERLSESAEVSLGAVHEGVAELSEAQGPLVVCTGVETGPSSLFNGLLRCLPSIWAALTPSGIQAVELPDPAGKLILATDGKVSDAEAAATLMARAKEQDWQTYHLSTPTEGSWGSLKEVCHGT